MAYVAGKPIMSDEEYDKLKQKLKVCLCLLHIHVLTLHSMRMVDSSLKLQVAL